MERQVIEEISEHFPGHNIVILAPTVATALQLKESCVCSNQNQELLTATPLELALDILEPDISMRGLKLITNDKIIDILVKITASLDERGELSRFGGYHQIASQLPGIYENIIKMRQLARGEQVLAAEWGDDSSSLLGRIRNEYELNLESWGCLDEPALFCQAAAMLEAGHIDGSGRIIVVVQAADYEPVVLNFVKVLMERGCKMGYGIELLNPINP